MTIFAFESIDKEVDLNAVADVMEKSGWKMERQLTSIHCTILPHHSMRRSAQLLDDLKQAVQTVRVGVLSQTGGCQGGCLVSNRRLSGWVSGLKWEADRVGDLSQTGGCQGGCLVSNRRLSGWVSGLK